jgi:hypothetical protein
MRYLPHTLFLLLTATTLAASPTTLPATLPSTQPAKTPDRSSPEKTWAALCAALKAGDLEAFRANFHSKTEQARVFVETFSDLSITTFALSKDVALLGDQGKELAKTFEKTHTDLVKNGENRTAEIKGDIAKWSRPKKAGQPDDAMQFKLINGEWLLDTVNSYALETDEGRESAQQLIDSAPKITAAIKAIGQDIRNKKITTIDQMRKRLAADTK